MIEFNGVQGPVYLFLTHTGDAKVSLPISISTPSSRYPGLWLLISLKSKKKKEKEDEKSSLFLLISFKKIK
jgi:hypothetical protein